MSQPHRLDPPAQHRAAARAGELAARGLVDGPELLEAIRQAARLAAPACDPAGLAMRLAHRYADAHAAILRAREAARRRIAFALAPLLDRRAPGPALLEAADAADPHGALSPLERRAIAEEAILRRLRQARAARG
jgi:hypothetical protein